MKRKIRINKIDGSYEDLNVTIATKVKVTEQMIHIDQLKSGDWRLIFTSPTIEEFSKIKNFEIIREGVEKNG